MPLYPELIEMITKMSMDEKFREHCRIVILQAIRSRETEKLSRKLSDEIIPRVASMKPGLMRSLILTIYFPKISMRAGILIGQRCSATQMK